MARCSSSRQRHARAAASTCPSPPRSLPEPSSPSQAARRWSAVVPLASGGSPSTVSVQAARACVTASCCSLLSGSLAPDSRNWLLHHVSAAAYVRTGAQPARLAGHEAAGMPLSSSAPTACATPAAGPDWMRQKAAGNGMRWAAVSVSPSGLVPMRPWSTACLKTGFGRSGVPKPWNQVAPAWGSNMLGGWAGRQTRFVLRTVWQGNAVVGCRFHAMQASCGQSATQRPLTELDGRISNVLRAGTAACPLSCFQHGHLTPTGALQGERCCKSSKAGTNNGDSPGSAASRGGGRGGRGGGHGPAWHSGCS